MRLFHLLFLIAALVVAVSAWEKEDHEIFDLVSALEGAEGKGTTFYSWLDVPSTASTAQINKAYRKKSMQLHPDKNPGVKGIHERFARLGVIGAILRDAESRKRYDFFYKNGVPKWRGTGYYYSRWRPGMLEVIIFLTFLTSSLQYLVQHMTYKNDLRRIDQVMSNAKLAAWGPKMIPVEGKRKVKVAIGGPTGVDDEGNVYGGRQIEMVVEGNGNVYILDESGDLHPLDTGSAIPAAIGRTWFISLVKSLIARLTNEEPKTVDKQEDNIEDDASETASDSPGSGTVTPREEDVVTALRAGRQAATKAGGRRRKAVRKRQ